MKYFILCLGMIFLVGCQKEATNCQPVPQKSGIHINTPNVDINIKNSGYRWCDKCGVYVKVDSNHTCR